MGGFFLSTSMLYYFNILYSLLSIFLCKVNITADLTNDELQNIQNASTNTYVSGVYNFFSSNHTASVTGVMH